MVQGVQIKDGIIQNINPSTGQPIHPPVSVTTPDQLYYILQTANISQNDWSDLPLSTRISLLRKSMSAVEQIADNLVGIITEEMGKVPSEAAQEVQNAIALKGEWLDLIQEANEDIHLGGDDDNNNAPESILTRDPYGVVAVLSPWNFPGRKKSPSCSFAGAGRRKLRRRQTVRSDAPLGRNDRECHGFGVAAGSAASRSRRWECGGVIGQERGCAHDRHDGEL